MKTNETGRSMVEMLGVLAIIGVLSVAGIAGYTQAMKKNKINNAVAEISMAVILAKTGNGGEGLTSGGTANLSDLGFNGKVLTAATIANENGEKDYKVSGITVKELDCTDLTSVAPSVARSPAATKAGYYIDCE
ncbi:MAG: hypothetical protein IKQ99_02870 [Alphaproteobacteria bacterium]|nr:hypothetical protein [Alphaproteobacteria bacterium]